MDVGTGAALETMAGTDRPSLCPPGAYRSGGEASKYPQRRRIRARLQDTVPTEHTIGKLEPVCLGKRRRQLIRKIQRKKTKSSEEGVKD